MIPVIMHLSIGSRASGKRIRLWIPIILVWLLLLILFILLLPFMLLAEFILFATNSYIPIIRIAWFPFILIAAMRGTKIHVAGKRAMNAGSVDITIL